MKGDNASGATDLNFMHERLRAMDRTFERDGETGTRLRAFVLLGTENRAEAARKARERGWL